MGSWYIVTPAYKKMKIVIKRDGFQTQVLPLPLTSQVTAQGNYLRGFSKTKFDNASERPQQG